MEKTLWASVQRLAPLKPHFVSVTYGADGSTRERTHNVVTRILRETPLTPAPHLTCIGAPRAEILAIARGYWDAGVPATSSPCAAKIVGVSRDITEKKALETGEKKT